MTSNSTNLVLIINNVTTQLNRYFSILIFSFGVLGNILNCFVLSKRTLRTNPCAFYFLTSSIASLISILSGLTTRMLAGYAVDLTSTVDWLCKLRAFVLQTSRTIAAWLLTFASIDRWYSSSINSAEWQRSSLKKAYISATIILVLSSVLYSQFFYCHQANLKNAPLKCYGKTEACRLAGDISYALITILVPIALMISFGLMTIKNVRQSRRRVFEITSKQIGNTKTAQSRWKRSDYSLLRMLLIQIALYSFLTLPQAIQKIHSTITEQHAKLDLQIAVENLVFNLVLLLTYFSSGLPFYVYTLFGGKVFREALVNLFKKPCA